MAKLLVNAKIDRYTLTNGEFEEGYVLTVDKESPCGLSWKPLDYVGTGELVSVRGWLTLSYENHTVENTPSSFYKDGQVLVVVKDPNYPNGINFVDKDSIVSSTDKVLIQNFLDRGQILSGEFEEGSILTVKPNRINVAWFKAPEEPEEPEEP